MKRDRRSFLQTVAWTTAGAALTSACGGGSTSSSGRKPNVLMIPIDDLNDWTGFLQGHPDVKTPNMDRLAAKSTVFRRAYCNAPVCNASRASAMSGLSPQQTRVFDNSTSIENSNPDAVYFPKHLAANGYEQKLIGKIYHVASSPVTHVLPADPPVTNKTCGATTVGSPQGYFDWAPLDVDDSAISDAQFVDAAIKYLSGPHDKPFFLGVGLQRTHVAWYVPRKWFDLYDPATLHIPEAPPGDLDDLPAAGRSIALQFNFHQCITNQNLWASAVQGYLASISFADAQVGRLLDALESSEYADNTIVILWGDHGFHLGEKFHWHKQALWERATRIPFTIRAIGQAAGNVVDAPVSLLDLAPTVFDLTGVTPPYAQSGRSVRPLMRDPSMAWNHPVLTTKDQHDHAVRTADWRYIRYRDGGNELYDERIDPNEYANVVADPANAEVVAALDALMPPRPGS
jgi:arylsulfatase A-like enzyme